MAWTTALSNLDTKGCPRRKAVNRVVDMHFRLP